MTTKSPQEDLSNGTKNISKQLVFTELSADQLAITKSPDTKLPISWESLNIIVFFNDHREALFNDHCEALFNVFLLAINRP